MIGHVVTIYAVPILYQLKIVLRLLYYSDRIISKIKQSIEFEPGLEIVLIVWEFPEDHPHPSFALLPVCQHAPHLSHPAVPIPTATSVIAAASIGIRSFKAYQSCC